jgi:endonuclease/exonuclease/phosphatase family metal-dependent hydrolase
MHSLKVVTINILSDLSRWKARRGLLAQGLAELQPDLVAVQEVRLPHNPARWLAEQLGLAHVYLSPKTGFEQDREAIAILSRLPFEAQETLDLQGQQRVAQYVQVRVGETPVVVANGHFYWQPGNSAARLRQVGRLVRWIKDIPGQPASIVCGDFNSTPETTAIELMRQHFISAYAAAHGQEPEYTCPTPLPRSRWAQLRTLLGFFVLIRPQHFNLGWRGTLDYIFVDARLRVAGCEIVLDKPAPGQARIYASDHFGLCATIEIYTQPGHDLRFGPPGDKSPGYRAAPDESGS